LSPKYFPIFRKERKTKENPEIRILKVIKTFLTGLKLHFQNQIALSPSQCSHQNPINTLIVQKSYSIKKFKENNNSLLKNIKTVDLKNESITT
jgi:hypothetical protein